MLQVHIDKCFCAIFYTLVVKYVAFREPVLGDLSPGLLLYELNRNQLHAIISLPLFGVVKLYVCLNFLTFICYKGK